MLQLFPLNSDDSASKKKKDTDRTQALCEAHCTKLKKSVDWLTLMTELRSTASIAIQVCLTHFFSCCAHFMLILLSLFLVSFFALSGCLTFYLTFYTLC